MRKKIYGFILVLGLISWCPAVCEDIWDQVEHGYAKNGEVKLHYTAIGQGPLVIMIHGFPDFWYSWRGVMTELRADYRLVAMDQRGYNQSDKPKEGEAYQLARLVEDVVAVILAQGEEEAIICGHDWGGMVAWTFAMTNPAMTERLIILNLPHPQGLMRELASNEQQRKNSEYARQFQREGAHLALNAEGLAEWVEDREVRGRYIEAFKRSSIEGMLHYYKQNYPRPPYTMPREPVQKVSCPVLMIHGLDDWALMSPALNGTWDWLDSDLTLVTIPRAGHFVQQDAADLVNRSIRMWLER